MPSGKPRISIILGVFVQGLRPLENSMFFALEPGKMLAF